MLLDRERTLSILCKNANGVGAQFISPSVTNGVGAQFISPSVTNGVGAQFISPSVTNGVGAQFISPSVPDTPVPDTDLRFVGW